MSYKRDFVLASVMFVAMAIVGTVFGLWFTARYAHQAAPPTLDARR